MIPVISKASTARQNIAKRLSFMMVNPQTDGDVTVEAIAMRPAAVRR